MLIGLLVFVDVAPAFAQSDDTHRGGAGAAAPDAVRPAVRRAEAGAARAGAAAASSRAQQPRRSGAASLPPPKPQVEKAPDATRLAVFGDSLAIDLSKALERLYAEDPNLVVINQGVSSSGFVRDDYFDWDAAITEQIAADSFDLAVVIIGINDRQELTRQRRDAASR